MQAKFTLSVLLAGAIVTSLPGAALADDSSGARTIGGDATGQLNDRHVTTPDGKFNPEIMLGNLRDIRLTLGQLKQQSINLFLEATRTAVAPTDEAVPTSPTSISVNMLSDKAKYLPPRKDWLLFYMNTMEPLVQLLVDDIKDIDAHETQFPQALGDKIDPLWKNWKTDVARINKALDDVEDLIAPNTGTNMALSKSALSIYDVACQLENIRMNVYRVVQQEYGPKRKSDAGVLR